MLACPCDAKCMGRSGGGGRSLASSPRALAGIPAAAARPHPGRGSSLASRPQPRLPSSHAPERAHRRHRDRPGAAGARGRAPPAARRRRLPAPARSATAPARSRAWCGRSSPRRRSWRAPARRCGCAAATPSIRASARRSTCAGSRSPAPGSFAPEDLLDGPARGVEQMEGEVRELLATIQEPHLRVLLERVFGEDSELWAGYRVAPAAKYYHQAYRHGLLEHCLGVAQAVSAISADVPGHRPRRRGHRRAAARHRQARGLHRRSPEHRPDRRGRLHGEIALGYYRIRRAIEDIEGFPAELAQAVGHIILSHHGTLEHGSPVVPCTREATLVHMIDNLGGRLGSFDRLEKELAPGRRWSGFDRAIGAGAFFAERGGERGVGARGHRGRRRGSDRRAPVWRPPVSTRARSRLKARK